MTISHAPSPSPSPSSGPSPLLVIPRARLADALRAGASAICGAASLVAGLREPWVLPLAVVLLAYPVSLAIKMADRRPALIAEPAALTVFRFPGASVRLAWSQITEIAYLKMRVKRVLFIKAEAPEGPTTVELASFDFRGRGAEIAARLNALRSTHA